MSEPFVGEIQMFAGSFAIRGWATCDGQLLLVNQNDALFSLLGTIYGGDGRTTFGLPDMRGRIPIHAGTGPGLTNRRLGAQVGAERVTLTSAQVGHDHDFNADTSSATNTSLDGAFVATPTVNTPIYSSTSPGTALAADSIGPAGSTAPQPHTNLMPTLCVTFLIALVGIYPFRS